MAGGAADCMYWERVLSKQCRCVAWRGGQVSEWYVLYISSSGVWPGRVNSSTVLPDIFVSACLVKAGLRSNVLRLQMELQDSQFTLAHNTVVRFPHGKISIWRLEISFETRRRGIRLTPQGGG